MKKLYILLMLTLLSSTAVQAGGMLIANSGIGEDSLTKDEVSKIFLGKKTSWSNGSGITASYQTNGASSDTFFKDIVGKKYKKFKKFWLKKVFSGNGVAPQTFDSSSKAVDFVKSTNGAVAYIDAGSAPAGVIVINVDGKPSF